MKDIDIDIDIVTTWVDGSDREWLDEKIAHSDVFENIGAHIINISPRKGSLISHYLDIFNLFRSSEYDIVEFHMMSYSWFEPILFARMLSGSKIIIHAHTTAFAHWLQVIMQTRCTGKGSKT